jgi:hypothetical protein
MISWYLFSAEASTCLRLLIDAFQRRRIGMIGARRMYISPRSSGQRYETKYTMIKKHQHPIVSRIPSQYHVEIGRAYCSVTSPS